MRKLSGSSMIAALGAFVLLASCRSSRAPEGAEANVLKRWVSIEKFPCFGHCQTYRMSVYRNGLILLEAKEHLDKAGVYFTEIRGDQLDKLRKMDKSITWQQLQAEYVVNIADLPVTEIHYYDLNGARIKSVRANANLPGELGDFAKELHQLIRSEKWTQLQRKSETTNPEVIYDEIIVEMDSTLTPEDMELAFSAYGLQREKRISPLMNLWNFRYDGAATGPYEMLVLIRKKAGVRHANFNRKILPREE